jgi:CubicO group peptidase (beta-lactamase class C family)
MARQSPTFPQAWPIPAPAVLSTAIRSSPFSPPSATVIHILAERGQLAYDTPIASYWPEFAPNGKEAVTVRHALCHTSGIPYLPDDGIGQEQLNDWDFMCRVIAQLKPAWPPGTKQFYHAHTYSWILGELCRRVDGRPFQRFVDEEINQRLGMQGLYSGLPAELDSRVAMIEPAPEFTETLSPPPRTNAPVMCPAHEWINTLPARRICHPGVNGIASARALARHYAALLPGGVDGVELLPPERVKLATEPQPLETGWVEGESDGRGLGYQLGIRIAEMGNNPTAFGHGGHGGSFAFADPTHHLAVGITRNRFSPTSLAIPIWNEIRTSLKIS